jgi:hypothetical protein
MHRNEEKYKELKSHYPGDSIPRSKPKHVVLNLTKFHHFVPSFGYPVVTGYVSYRTRTLLSVMNVSEMAKEVLIWKSKKAK